MSVSVLRFSILWRIDPLLGNSRKQTGSHAITEELLEAVFSVVRSATVAKQRRGKHTSAEAVELRGPCGGVINRSSLELRSVVGYVPDGKDIIGQC
jgi:hypothetical protein